MPVLALRTGRNFHPFPEQVETFGLSQLILFPHMIKGTDLHRIVGDENELVAVLLFRVLT